ncbi:MAG: hypothetical protein IPP44_14945 [Ideonella sp.]|nr:hypothetical protein [Ideonella sp.]
MLQIPADGHLFIGEQGEVFKAFHALDGHGLKLQRQGGIQPVIITGRDWPPCAAVWPR